MSVSRVGRLDALDRLRGLVMVLMALDHARGFFWLSEHEPTDLAHTDAATFATRWVTHLCAPVFYLLAGTGAWLALERGRSRRALAWFLASRGLWLIVLEATIVKLGWESYNASASFFNVGVIAGLGASMIVMAALVFLPLRGVLAFAVVMIAGHDALDGIAPDGAAGAVWTLLHVKGELGGPPGEAFTVGVMYPLIPWVGVMALGFASGALITRPELRDDATARARLFVRVGLAMLAAFVALRLANVYGDPAPWAPQDTAALTVMSFLNVTKYPASLAFVLATLGVAALVLAACEGWRGRAAGVALVFGRVPLFYYVLHLPLIHHGMVLVYYLDVGAVPSYESFVPGWGSLGQAYVAWLAAVAVLYLPCRWFAGVKARRRDWWLSYL